MPEPASSGLIIRPETPGDADAIRALTAAAFAGAPHASGTEPAIVDALRRDGDLVLSLVATDDADVVGHVAFSPVTVGGAGGYCGLGPISVAPTRQRSGIGTALIERGLAELCSRSARGCVLVGDPGYYARFGFEAGQLTYEGVPDAYVQGLGLADGAPEGVLAYAPGFAAH